MTGGDGDARTTERLTLRPPGPDDRPPTVEVLWSIDPARHGEGFAVEAATAALAFAAELELDEVFAMILPSNVASLRVAGKVGMTRDGNVDHAGFDHLLLRHESGSPGHG